MGYTNSNLVTYTKISPNRTSPRNHIIDTITIHCYVGQVTAKSGCNASHFVNYDPHNGASCNYVVGYDGSIGLCVEEKDRAWTSGGSLKVNGISGSENDHRAVTIEVACEPYNPYEVTDKALSALINLCADICKRNNIKELKWKADKSLVGQVDKQNMTVHRWFANKACPGDYLYNKHSYIAQEVNKKLNPPLDYSSVYDFNYYIKKYPDLSIYKSNQAEALNHFINFGMNEGRQAIANFNVFSYAYKYPDLRKTYGNNLKLYYEHYIKYGKKEGRVAKNTKEMQNYATVYNGIDYSLVYDYNYYVNKYSDVKKAYGIDDTAVLKHFVVHGMSEGRQASAKFNVKKYKNNYKDLRKAYGNNLKSYYEHYIKFGHTEGRKAI